MLSCCGLLENSACLLLHNNRERYRKSKSGVVVKHPAMNFFEHELVLAYRFQIRDPILLGYYNYNLKKSRAPKNLVVATNKINSANEGRVEASFAADDGSFSADERSCKIQKMLSIASRLAKADR
jgi:hypothetical protein